MATDNVNTGFQIGEKIRSFRIMRHMTQKQLAEKCGLSESAIRNYELGNRYPDEVTLMDIADSLEVDRASLRDPDPDNTECVEHFMFTLEQIYGLVPKLIDGELHLVFDKTSESDTEQQIIKKYLLADLLYNWCGIRDMMLEGKLTPDEYHAWQIAHSDLFTTEEPLNGYKLPLQYEIEMEKARRALGKMPAPVYDENHVNVLPVPKKKGTVKQTDDDMHSDPPVKTKRKRKPKNK